MPDRRCHRPRRSEMPKMKTKSSAKKRFRLTGTGKVRMNVANKRHMLTAKPQKMKRQARGTRILNDSDARIVLVFMPYARASPLARVKRGVAAHACHRKVITQAAG